MVWSASERAFDVCINSVDQKVQVDIRKVSLLKLNIQTNVLSLFNEEMSRCSVYLYGTKRIIFFEDTLLITLASTIQRPKPTYQSYQPPA